MSGDRVTGLGSNTPAWRGSGCPFAYLSHAAVLLTPYLPAPPPQIAGSAQIAHILFAKQSRLASYLAGLPASRGPPTLA